MYEKLTEIYEMVNFILDKGEDMDNLDTVTLYQCELPTKLREIQEELLAMIK